MKCRLCVGKYHYECLRLTKSQFSSFTPVYRSSWICPECTNVTRRNRSTESSPVRPSTPCSTMETCEVAHDDVRSLCASPSPETPVTMDKISCLLDQKLNIALSNFMTQFRAALADDIKASIRTEVLSQFQTIKEEFSTTTDFICAEQQMLKEQIHDKEKSIKKLESENNRLQTELHQLSSRLSSVEKISRSCNVEVQAVPEANNENTINLFKKICDIVNLSISESNVLACRRVAKMNTSSSRPRNVLVSLASPRLRDEVLSAVHRYNKSHPTDTISTSHLGLAGEARRIYVTEHLSPEQKALHAAARIAAKEMKFKYVWVKFGRIYVRKDDMSKAILIKSEDTLNKLKQN